MVLDWRRGRQIRLIEMDVFETAVAWRGGCAGIGAGTGTTNDGTGINACMPERNESGEVREGS